MKRSYELLEIENKGIRIVYKDNAHPIEEAEIAEESNEPKVTKSITQPDVTLEYYKKSKIFKFPFFEDEIRIYIEFI